MHRDLIEGALRARKNAYAPYSRFAVGAALHAASGRVYTGANVENAAHSPGCCAERVAIFSAVAAGERDFEAIAIAGGPESIAPEALEPCPPCGVCLQVMMEFCDPERFRVILPSGSGEAERFFLAQLLPRGFGPGALRRQSR